MADKKRSIAEIVALEGTPLPEEKDNPPVNVGEGINIQAGANSTVIIGGASHSVHAQSMQMPKPKSIKEMNADERQAFADGSWDGLERRSRDDSKEYVRALRKRAKRKKDTQIKTLHYTILALLFLALFSSFAGSLLMESQL